MKKSSEHILTKSRPCTIWVLTVIIILTTIFDHSISKIHDTEKIANREAECDNSETFHRNIVEKYYEKRMHWKTSNLGTIIFKNIDPKFFASREDDVFLVMVWKNWKKLVGRHAYNYDSRVTNLLSNCSVKNCKFSGNTDHFYLSDAVIMSGDFIPKLTHRNWNQRWIFLSEESPMTAAFFKPPYDEIKYLANIFNWTMTYRTESDIPIPYGRTVPLRVPNDVYMDDPESALSQLVPHWSEKQFVTLATIIIYNCTVKQRTNYLTELRTYMKIDVHGNCSHIRTSDYSCTTDKKADCPLAKDYLFYLVFENASCHQYITENCYYHGYTQGAVPVIMGPPFDDCKGLLPPNSFIHVSNFKTAGELAAYMQKVSENYDELLHYHAWRAHFEVKNEHGYFGTKSSLFCRICEGLNYNDGGFKSYGPDELEVFFGKKDTCDLKYA